MSQNEIKMKLTMDEQAFEREAEQMARTMDKMYERSYSSANNVRQQQILNQNLGGIGMPQNNSPTAAQFKSATNMGDNKFREEAQAQMRIIDQKRDMLKKNADTIASLENEQRKYLKASKESLEIEKSITKEKINQAKIEQDLVNHQTQLNQVFKQRSEGQKGTGGKMLDTFANGGGVGGAMKTGIEAVGGGEAMLALGVAGAAAFAIRQLTSLADGIFREFASVNRVTATASGNAVSGSTGNYMQQVYGGRSVFEAGNAGERSRALKDSMTEEGKLRGSDAIKAGDWGDAGKYGGPQVQAASLGFGALNSVLGDDMQQARFYGRFNDKQMGKYNAMSTERMVRNYGQNLENSKNQDPGKQLALGHYEQTYNRDLGMQRQLGLDDGMLTGSNGFFKNYQNKGYTDEQGIGAMNNIMGAGGSTRMGRDPSTALAFSKNFDMTNADSSLGKLSGNFGDSQKSKSALIEITAEGTRLGLNKSEFREEQRKFTEAAAGFLAKGYSGTDSDMERMMSVFGGGLNAKTGVGIASASNAADVVSGVSSQGTGPEGALGFSSLLSSKNGKRLSAQSQQALNTMDLKDVTLNNPRIAAMAMEASDGQNQVSPQDIIDTKMQSVKDKLFRNKDMQNVTEDVTRMKDIKFPGKSNAEITELANKGDPDAKKIVEKLGIAQDYVGNAYGISNDQNKLDALTDSLGHFGNKGYNIPDDSRKMIEKQLNGESGRVRDETNKGVANDQAYVTDKTDAMRNDFESMATASKTMSKEMIEAMLLIQQIATNLKGLTGNDYDTKLRDAVTKAANAAGNMATPSKPANQAQAGKH